MRLTQIGLLALASKAAHGYLDASPFFMFSTSELLLPTNQIQSGSKVTSDVKSTLLSCPSDFYLLVNQPGVAGSDFSTPESAPTLSKFLRGQNVLPARSSAMIPEVVGKVDLESIEQELRSRCGARSTVVDASVLSFPVSIDSSTQVLSVDFSAPSKAQPERAVDVLSHDQSLTSLLEILHPRNYTVIFTTTPESQSEPPREYQMNDYYESLHTDLKRDVPPAMRQKLSNETLVDGPLFERYQFLTPGLFTALAVSLLLLSILYVAISGLAGLEVSYAAFEKENGPAGSQKKAQ